MNAFPIIIRPEYLEICEGDHCAAAILDLFKRWSSSKLKKQADTWIYKSQPELQRDLMNLFGRNKVAAALLRLREWGYLKHRENPRNRQDKTLQYQIDSDLVNEVMALLSGVSDIEIGSPESRNEGFEALKLKSQAPNLSAEESMNQSSITSGMSSEGSSSPADHPDDDDLAFFKFYEKRFGSIQAHREQLRMYAGLMSAPAIIEVLERCAASQGRSWSYVLTALSNASSKEGETRRPEGTDRAKWKDDPSPAQDSKPPGVPPTVSPDVPTEPDIDVNTEPTPDPDVTPAVDNGKPEDTIWRGLEFCMDAQTYNRHVRPSKVLRIEGETWVIEVPNAHSLQAMEDPRLLKVIQRALNVQALRFECRKVAA